MSEPAFKDEGNALKVQRDIAKRQMAVCTCLHTKGDTLRADFAPPKQ